LGYQYGIIDAHCDAIWKMWETGERHFYDAGTATLVNYQRLKQSRVAVQSFAVFVPPRVHQIASWQTALDMIDLFYQYILKDQHEIQLILDRQSLNRAVQQQKIGALLTIENAGVFQEHLPNVRVAYQLGVRSVGLTWNGANALADGTGERRGGGLTHFGRAVVKEMNRLNMIVDISHLSEAAFWDVAAISESPIIASHSNAKAICTHPRNLTDKQISAIIQKNGMIGLTFVPEFISDSPSVDALMLHIEHILSLGGEDALGFGSDFDGSDRLLPGLSHSGEWSHLINRLSMYFNESIVEKLLFKNWWSFYQKALK
jgi:membrane dipeptidase